jgi:hypothetical protein
MGMTGISKSQVSRLCGEIDGKIAAFLDAERRLMEIGAGKRAQTGRNAPNSPTFPISPGGIETEMPKYFMS